MMAAQKMHLQILLSSVCLCRFFFCRTGTYTIFSTTQICSFNSSYGCRLIDPRSAFAFAPHRCPVAKTSRDDVDCRLERRDPSENQKRVVLFARRRIFKFARWLSYVYNYMESRWRYVFICSTHDCTAYGRLAGAVLTAVAAAAAARCEVRVVCCLLEESGAQL